MVPVTDQDAALAFYVDDLGREEVDDVTYATGERWLEVSPAKGSSHLCLVLARPERPAGIETGIVLLSTDVLADLNAGLRTDDSCAAAQSGPFGLVTGSRYAGNHAGMGLWERHLLPRVINACNNGPHVRQVRERMCRGLTGEVVEIGFGSGLNAPYYPPAVSRVLAVEPSDLGWGLAAGRVAASPVPVERIGLDGQALPLPDHSVDSALSTWTLCTIPDPGKALAELRRVLKPGGRLTFIEHGLSPDTGVATWQRRLDPLQRRMVGGCRLTLPVLLVVEEAGFAVEHIENEYEEGAPKPLGYLYEGTAVSPR